MKRRAKHAWPDTLPKLPQGQKWYRGQTVSNWSSTSNKITQDVKSVDVGGFRYQDSHIRWELQPVELEVTNCIRLLRKFRREWRWWIKPIAWIRNETVGGADVILVLYSKGFSIRIDRYGNEIFGPHPCTLFYKSWQDKTEVVWVAICQIEAMWHSDERMLKALNHSIRNGELWQSDQTAQTIVIK